MRFSRLLTVALAATAVATPLAFALPPFASAHDQGRIEKTVFHVTVEGSIVGTWRHASQPLPATCADGEAVNGTTVETASFMLPRTKFVVERSIGGPSRVLGAALNAKLRFSVERRSDLQWTTCEDVVFAPGQPKAPVTKPFPLPAACIGSDQATREAYLLVQWRVATLNRPREGFFRDCELPTSYFAWPNSTDTADTLLRAKMKDPKALLRKRPLTVRVAHTMRCPGKPLDVCSSVGQATIRMTPARR